MRKVIIGFAMTLALALQFSEQGESQEKAAKGKQAVFATAEDSKYKEVAPGISKAVLWGNPEKSAYGAFTKFKPGLDNGMHTHTNDTWLIVIKGAYLYKDESGEKRVGPGAFIRIPAKHKHWSGGDAKEGALFYEEASGKFDLLPAK